MRNQPPALSSSGKLRGWSALLLSGLALAAGGRQAAAQSGGVSTAQIVNLAAAKVGNLSVSVTSGATQSIGNLANNAVNDFPSPATVITQWDLNPGQSGAVVLVAYFSAPSQALSGPGGQIPASRVLGQVPTGLPTTYTAITNNGVGGVGTAGGSLRLFSQNITGQNKKSSRTDNLFLRLDLVGMALPAGSYTGTLNIRAVVQ